jgi:hypothetical protein
MTGSDTPDDETEADTVELNRHNYREARRKIDALCDDPGVDEAAATRIQEALFDLPEAETDVHVTVSREEITAFIEDLGGFLDDVAALGANNQAVAEIEEHIAQIEDTVPGFSPQVDPDAADQPDDSGDDRLDDEALAEAKAELGRMLAAEMQEDPEFFYEVAERKEIIEKLDDNPELEAQVQDRIEEIREEHDID